MHILVDNDLNEQITSDIVDSIAEKTGLPENQVEEMLLKLYPRGAIGAFLNEYFEMAFKGSALATEFEIATADLFREMFGYETSHVGPVGLSPDVVLCSEEEGYQAIIDTKAYSKYSITNDHHNRMVYNYLKDIDVYSCSNKPMAFFTYIAGGFGSNIDSQIARISKETSVHGSAITVSNVIKMMEKQQSQPYSHGELKKVFSCDRSIGISDL